MTDVHTKKQRSYNMSKIHSSETRIELKIRQIMKSLGFSYHPKNVYGKPDFVNRKMKIAVFVDGCFWHRCPKHYKEPEQNKKFWKNKINKNTARDKLVTKKLKKEGWRVIRVWEHSLRRIK